MRTAVFQNMHVNSRVPEHACEQLSRIEIVCQAGVRHITTGEKHRLTVRQIYMHTVAFLSLQPICDVSLAVIPKMRSKKRGPQMRSNLPKIKL